jgi:hypothetical protein
MATTNIYRLWGDRVAARIASKKHRNVKPYTGCLGPKWHARGCTKRHPKCRWNRPAPCRCGAYAFPHAATTCRTGLAKMGLVGPELHEVPPGVDVDATDAPAELAADALEFDFQADPAAVAAENPADADQALSVNRLDAWAIVQGGLKEAPRSAPWNYRGWILIHACAGTPRRVAEQTAAKLRALGLEPPAFETLAYDAVVARAEMLGWEDGKVLLGRVEPLAAPIPTRKVRPEGRAVEIFYVDPARIAA